MVTAFQPSAFQNNAFQIDITGSDGGGKRYEKESKKKKKLLKKMPSHIQHIVEKYNKAVIFQNATEHERRALLSSVDPFVLPVNKDELEKRTSAKYIFEVPPPVERVNFEALYTNQLAMQKFSSVIETMEKKNAEKLQEIDDDISLFMIAAMVN